MAGPPAGGAGARARRCCWRSIPKNWARRSPTCCPTPSAFRPPGGTIRVQLSAQRRTLCASTSSDQGPGVAEADRERVFEPFYRGERQPQDALRGTGIGLSIVQEYIAAHGGRVGLLSDSQRRTFPHRTSPCTLTAPAPAVQPLAARPALLAWRWLSRSAAAQRRPTPVRERSVATVDRQPRRPTLRRSALRRRAPPAEPAAQRQPCGRRRCWPTPTACAACQPAELAQEISRLGDGSDSAVRLMQLAIALAQTKSPPTAGARPGPAAAGAGAERNRKPARCIRWPGCWRRNWPKHAAPKSRSSARPSSCATPSGASTSSTSGWRPCARSSAACPRSPASGASAPAPPAPERRHGRRRPATAPPSRTCWSSTTTPTCCACCPCA